MKTEFVSAKFLAVAALILGVGIASAADVTYYSGDIWAGQSIDVGSISAVMHYVSADDATLEVKYETYGGWRISEAHLWLDSMPPAGRGAPGQYPYKSGPINATSYSFLISIAELRSQFGIDWESSVYIMPHAAVYLDANNNGQYDSGEQGQTGFGGNVIKPKRGSWFGFFGFVLTKPEVEPRQLYGGETRTRGFWRRAWTDPASKGVDPADYFPVTLAGVLIEDADDALAIFGTPVEGEMWNQFLAQFLATYCNTIRTDGLEDAWYDDATVSGEFMENKQVSYIIGVANTYTPATSEPTLEAMKDVFDAINNNWEAGLNILWNGPQGRPVQLSDVRVSVKPNPFSGSARIQFASGLGSGVSASVYDVSGKKVRELAGAGSELFWDGRDANGQELAAGVYLVQVSDGARSGAARVVVSR